MSIPESGIKSKVKQNAILIGSGEEMRELRHEVNNNNRYDFQFVQSIDLDNYNSIDFKEDVVKTVYEDNISIIVVDIKNQNANEIIPSLYNLIFAKVQFLDKYKVYESIFDRIPLFRGRVHHVWRLLLHHHYLCVYFQN